MQKQILFAAIAFMLLAILPQVQAARIYGNVYGPELDLARGTIVKANSTPEQIIVAADGSYSFELTPGNYAIEAIYSKQNVFYAKEDINIKDEGNYVLDLILFETPEIEELEFDETELALIEKLLEKKTNITLLVVVITIVIIGIAIAYLVYKYKKKRKKLKLKVKKKPKKKEKIFSPDETLNKVINLIKKEKRTTQKDIRKQLNISEAKISLLITDLEDRKLVKKIKKGRGNIIIWQG